MRRISYFIVIVLCLAILFVDVLAFYWLQSITQLFLSPLIKNIIHIAFWFFTIGLIGAIFGLKVRMDHISERRRQWLVSFLYGLGISSFIPKLIFVIVISVLYFMNFMFSDTASLLVVPLVGLFSGFLPFGMILYGVFVSLYRFKVYHENITFKGLPKELKGLRIVHISDLHLGSFNYRYHIFDKAIKIINRLGPDYIFFTGDLVNNFAWELKGWKDTLDKLSAKHGKYAVLGNHDYGDYSAWKSEESKQQNFETIKKFHKDIGFKLLLNEAEIVHHDGEQMAIVGVENWGNPPYKKYGDLKKALESVNDVPFKILLSHDPCHWGEEVVGKTNVALTLSGHTHGMQFGIKLKQYEWSPSKYRYKEWGGLYQNGEQYIYVNRGLGWLGLPARLGMRPEITFITFD